MTKIAIRIEIEYDNGEVWQAKGSDANDILEHWQGGEVINYIHGMKYTGPVMVKIREQVS